MERVGTLVQDGEVAPIDVREGVVERPAIAVLECLVMLRSVPLVGDIRQRGLLAAVELVADKNSKTPLDPSLNSGSKVCRAARERGVWLRPLRDTLVIMPPLSVSSDQIRTIVDAVAYGLKKL